MYCEKCGAKIPEEKGIRFCSKCGKPIEIDFEEKMSSFDFNQPENESEINENIVRCSKCDRKLDPYEINAEFNQGKLFKICTECHGKELEETQRKGKIQESPSLIDAVTDSIQNAVKSYRATGRDWIGAYKALLYIAWGVFIIASMVFGGMLARGWGALIGFILSFVIGFCLVAFGMVFVYTAENVANTTDSVHLVLENTTSILQIMNKIQENQKGE